jgi:hypothetical protein
MIPLETDERGVARTLVRPPQRRARDRPGVFPGLADVYGNAYAEDAVFSATFGLRPRP